MQCPHCKKDDQIQKVTAITSAGTSTIDSQGRATTIGIGTNFHGVGLGAASTSLSSQGVQSSVLVQKLAPPNPPLEPRAHWQYICYFLTFIMFVSLFDSTDRFAGFVLLMIFGILSVITTINNQQEKAQYQKYLKFYHNTCERWNNLYYCHRCDGVFQEHSEFIPINKMREYLRTNSIPSNSHTQKDIAATVTNPSPSKPQAQQPDRTNEFIESKLKLLSEMHKDSLITEEEYAKRKTKILDKML